MHYLSIRTKAMILLTLLMVLPVVFIGLISAAYFQDSLRHDIWNENLDQAKIIATFTENYADSALLYIESQSSRPSVYEAVNTSDIAYLQDNIAHIQNSSIFYAVYATNASGTVLSSYPVDIRGYDYSEKPWVRAALDNGTGYVSDAMLSPVTGRPTFYVSGPITHNGSIIGALVGAIDLDYYALYITESQTRASEYVYVVNRTGRVMLHSNYSYMGAMADFTDRPAVQDVLRGESGVTQQLNPDENAEVLASYAPVQKYGWGVVVSLPLDVAYQPLQNALRWFVAFLGLMVLLAAACAGVIGATVVRPLVGFTRAAGEMPSGDYRKDLPLERRDEVGDLARAFDRMAGEIRANHRTITEARDRAEAEKAHAELYVDIMGHDINNLNQVALTSLEFLLDEPALAGDDRRLLEMALASVNGSAEIIENVRKIQQITGEQLELEDVDVNDLIVRCVKEAPRPEGRAVTINYAERPGLYVRAVPLLKELFCNLVNNAIKHSERDVTVDIDVQERVEGDRKCYRIAIADNGPGIPDDVKPKLFRRFQRGTTKAHGKGLGLYIVKMLAERFGGSVTVEDRVPGDYAQGAKFVVTLPVASEK